MFTLILVDTAQEARRTKTILIALAITKSHSIAVYPKGSGLVGLRYIFQRLTLVFWVHTISPMIER
jgi:hypothetical protein